MRFFVLGAGTSVCAGGPVVADFQEAARESLAGAETFEGEERSRFEAAFQAWQSEYEDLDVERFYTAADLVSQLGRTPAELALAENVQCLIAKTLEYQLRNATHDWHVTLVDQLATQDAVITLNWDILLDNAARGRIDYGFEPCAMLEAGQATPLGAAGNRKSVLKLHGSLNWFFCNGHGLHVTRTKGVLDYWKRGPIPCPQCRAPMERGFVPPTAQKLGSPGLAPLLRKIWTGARTALISSEELYFCGYSFPASDQQMREFVRDALRRNTVLERIVIVNPNKRGSAQAEFEDRMIAIFRHRRRQARLIFIDQSFETWVDRGCKAEPVSGPARFS